MRDPEETFADEPEETPGESSDEQPEERVVNGMIVNLGVRQCRLYLPESAATAFDLLELSQRSARRAAAAALLVCGRLQPVKPGRPEVPLTRFTKIDPGSHGFEWAKIGGLAYDKLLALKLPRADLLHAGTDALLLIVEHCKTVDGADSGNSEGTPSTS